MLELGNKRILNIYARLDRQVAEKVAGRGVSRKPDYRWLQVPADERRGMRYPDERYLSKDD